MLKAAPSTDNSGILIICCLLLKVHGLQDNSQQFLYVEESFEEGGYLLIKSHRRFLDL